MAFNSSRVFAYIPRCKALKVFEFDRRTRFDLLNAANASKRGGAWHQPFVSWLRGGVRLRVVKARRTNLRQHLRHCKRRGACKT